MHRLLKQFIDFAREENLAGDAFMVGGAVRDLLSGKETKDVDIVIKENALITAQKFARFSESSFVMLDENFGVARVVRNGFFLDISDIKGDSIYTDLAERDITINAMAMHLENIGRLHEPPDIIDPFDAKNDLQRGIIRMVSEENLVKDPLRLLRIYRFAATMNFSIEPNTLDALRRIGLLISSTAPERIMDELRHILILSDSHKTFSAMHADGFLSSIFAEFKKSSLQEPLSLYEKTEEALNNLQSYFFNHAGAVSGYFNENYRTACLKLSALFHSQTQAKSAAARLRMSRKEAGFLSRMVKNRKAALDLYEGSEDINKKTALAFYKQFHKDIYPLLILGAAYSAISSGKEEMPHFLKSLISFYCEDILPKSAVLPLITGDDLISYFHLTPSPFFKEILESVEDMVLEGRIISREDALKAVKEMLKTRR